MFLYISPGACTRVRTSLSMKNSESFYLDVTSQDETQKRLVLLPAKVGAKDWEKLRHFFGNRMQEIEFKEVRALSAVSRVSQISTL